MRLKDIDKLSAMIDRQMHYLRRKFKEEPNQNKNHLASMILGEMDGLEWVKECIAGTISDDDFDDEPMEF